MSSNLSCPNKNAKFFREQNEDVVGIERLGPTRHLHRHILLL